MFFGVAKIQCVNHHSNVGRVLAALAHVGYFDELEGRFVHRGFEGFVTVPVAIGFLGHNAALYEQSLKHFLNIKLGVFGIAHTQRDILEIAEYGEAGFAT